MNHRLTAACLLLALVGCEDKPIAPVALATPIPAAASPTWAPLPTGAPPERPPTVVTFTPAPSPGASAAPAKPAALLVPLYDPPNRDSWERVATLPKGRPGLRVEAIVNPDNGPLYEDSEAWTEGVARLQAGGVRVLGYVATGYGDRPEDDVVADFQLWRAHLPAVDGLFLDEVSNDPGTLPFYERVVHAGQDAGFRRVFGNAGTTSDPVIDALFDVVVVYEGEGPPRRSPPPGLARDRMAALVHSAPYFDEEAFFALSQTYGWLWFTDRALTPNPWAGLSLHAEAMADEVLEAY